MKKSAIFSSVDLHRDKILAAERFIWENPETGYREYRTGAYMEKLFEDLGYRLTRAGNVPGFFTEIDTGRPGPKILVFGELDSVICPTHPEANKETGAVHACGHHAQCAALYGLAAALKAPGALDGLCGKIMLCAVPAEEYLEADFRESLRAEGKIHYHSGKTEFLYRGYFDDVDMAMMVHTTNAQQDFRIIPGGVGFVYKKFTFHGVSAHAGGSPQLGVNALYAATNALSAANALRETFVEQDLMRFHPILSAGGNAVSAIPDTAVIESYVRGKTFDAILRESTKINRAFAGNAAAIGATLTLSDIPGMPPTHNSVPFLRVAKDAMLSLSQNILERDGYSTGSTDMGTMTAVMPAIHPYVGGASGTSHGSDYRITDPEKACVTSAKMQLATLHLLLENEAVRAKEVLAETKIPYASKEAFFKDFDRFDKITEAVSYQEDGTVLLTP
ncbi:MAG: amidohydrolase [Ruminococcaceae bacterium]|nr:amidohydrolase [Oscillospiraceae bacterium]